MLPRSRQGKLRASCDSCNEARVRCSQTRPACERCSKNNIGCIYGVSQRAGRNRGLTRNRGVDEAVLPLLHQPARGQIDDGFSPNSMPFLDTLAIEIPGQELPDSNILSEIFPQILAMSPLPTMGRTSDVANSTLSLEDAMRDTAACACVPTVFAFLSTHPMLTVSNSVPIDACLVQGRAAMHACERIIHCICTVGHNYSAVLTAAILIDRVVAIYERARQHYEQTILGLPYSYRQRSTTSALSPGELFTASSSSSLLAGNMPPELMDTSGSPEDVACTPGSAFIGQYQLDQDDYVKMTFDIVFRHLFKVGSLVTAFKKGISGGGHGGMVATPPMDEHALQDDNEAVVCLGLANLIDRQLDGTRNGWELLCKEWEQSQ